MASQKPPDGNSTSRAAPGPRGAPVPNSNSSLHLDNGSDASSELHLETKSFKSFTPQPKNAFPEDLRGDTSARGPQIDNEVIPFDIRRKKTAGFVTLKKSLLEMNRERRKSVLNYKPLQHVHLAPGMILLKNYIRNQDQVRIILKCQELGLGAGGFYIPHYGDGARMHLHMMCLGMNWDPENKEYNNKRAIDGSEPPKLPESFRNLVDDAIQASRGFLTQINHDANEIPKMTPDICIVNFYSKTGRLGLHQDKDESDESLQKGLPVVSFSLGDSAEFLYGKERNVDTASKVILESGDVLIFGAESRLIFHGVSSILPDTAPKQLIDDTRLLPGRLNLTFRKY